MVIPLIDINWPLVAVLFVAGWLFWQVFIVRRPH